MAIFDGRQNRHPSTDHQKICHRWLRRRPLRLCQIRCISVQGGLLGTWVKYNQNYCYLYPFLGTHLEVRHRDGFSRMMAQTTRTRARMCLFGIWSRGSPFRGSKPRTPNLGAWLGIFKPNLQNRKRAYYRTCCIDFNQILHSDKDHQIPFMGGPKHTHHKSKIADGRHLGKIEKSPYLERFRQNLTQ